MVGEPRYKAVSGVSVREARLRVLPAGPLPSNLLRWPSLLPAFLTSTNFGSTWAGKEAVVVLFRWWELQEEPFCFLAMVWFDSG
jgi:hypothetical protein